MTAARPALFLDRDGVINVDHAYVHRKEDVDFVDGIFDLCIAAKRRGYLVIVVTNQAGIGRGYYTEHDFHVLTDWMKAQFRQRGADIDAVYFSPYHPEHGIGAYRKDADCRKPRPGMLLRAAREFGIDVSRSVLVGDNDTDVQAGMAAGVGRNLLFAPQGGASRSGCVGAHAVLADLRDAIACL